MILGLARKSLWNRRGTALLTLVSLAISVALILGINHLRHEAKESFTSTISGTDLIVGARSGPVQLLLYSVFRIGDATNNISWQSYSEIAGRPEVAWAVPLSLGDSHRGFRVVGTTTGYFEHYRFGRDRGLRFVNGRFCLLAASCVQKAWSDGFNHGHHRFPPTITTKKQRASARCCNAYGRATWPMATAPGASA